MKPAKIINFPHRNLNEVENALRLFKLKTVELEAAKKWLSSLTSEQLSEIEVTHGSELKKIADECSKQLQILRLITKCAGYTNLPVR